CFKSAALIWPVLFALALFAGWAASAADNAEPTILERGVHYRVVQGPSGGSYTELANGLCYQDASGQWLDSKEEIELLPEGGAVARQGQHQLFFPANLKDGVLELRTAQGKFVSRTLGLSYFDAATGQSILISDLKSSVGQLVSKN